MPAKIVQLEVTEPIPSITGTDRYDEILIWTRYRGRPLGQLRLPNGDRAAAIPASRIRKEILAQQHWSLTDLVIKDRVAPEPPSIEPPPMSLIVASTGQPEQLTRCLEGLGRDRYPAVELLVVDGSPNRAAARAVALRFGARFIEAEAPGLAAARNRGAAESTADLLAFTVDRATPDPRWVESVARAFHDPMVSVVTGLVTPAELETVAQLAAENDFGRWLGAEARIIRGSELSRAQLLWTFHYGSGANLAIRRSVLSEIGGFAPDLGDESGWDATDADLLRRVLAGGNVLRYEPAAIVRIEHPSDPAELRRAIHTAAASQGAMAIEAWRSGQLRFRELVMFGLHGLVKRPLKRIVRPGYASRDLVLTELRGVLASPAGYGSRRRARRAAGTGGAVESTPTIHPNPPERIAPPPVPTPAPEAVRILVVRTRYRHWGRYSGMNQFLRFLDPQRFAPVEHLVPESDAGFPIRSGAIRNWLRHRIQRDGMPWYGLNDLWGELTTIGDYWGMHRPAVVHYLDGEHSAQYLPRIGGRRRLPRTVATFHQPADVLAKVIRRDVVRRFDRIAAVAEDQAEFLAGLASPERVVVTPHGIDTDFFSPGSVIRHGPAPFRCLSVGHNYRDYAAVRDTARLLRDRPIEFHVVSPRPSGLEQLPNARSYRNLSDEELRQLYRDCDVLLLPLTKVTANNAVLEAMACGLPIISTELPAMRLYVDPRCALLAPANAPRDLADAVELLRNDPGKRVTMGRAARERAVALDWRRIAPLYEEIYQALG